MGGWGWERGDGTVGMGAWGWERGVGNVFSVILKSSHNLSVSFFPAQLKRVSGHDLQERFDD